MQARNNILVNAIVALLCVMTPLTALAQNKGQQPATVKKERNAISAGNKLYKDKRYAEAEVQYRKALEANPNSEIAQFNLASSLIKQEKPMPQMQQGGGEQQLSQPMQEATGLLQKIAETSSNKQLAGKASYDLGNIAYHQQNFAEAITHYKQALRKNPDNNDARYNLRMAQLKKQQQDKNKDNKDQNKDNKDQNKDNKDQNKDKQDKNKDQNKDKQDQNKDKQNQDKKDQNKQDQQKQKKQQQQQQPKDGISKQNMDRILQTMQDKERETQQKMNEQKAQMQRSERARTSNKW